MQKKSYFYSNTIILWGLGLLVQEVRERQVWTNQNPFLENGIRTVISAIIPQPSIYISSLLLLIKSDIQLLFSLCPLKESNHKNALERCAFCGRLIIRKMVTNIYFIPHTANTLKNTQEIICDLQSPSCQCKTLLSSGSPLLWAPSHDASFKLLSLLNI